MRRASIAKRVAKATGKPYVTVFKVLSGSPHAERYSAETRQAVLDAAAELQARAQRAAQKRRETLRSKRVTVTVLCRCGEETCVTVPTTRTCDRCGATADVFNWCASCGQLMCKACTAGWETRPDLGRLHALVCYDCTKGGDAHEAKSLPTAAICEQATTPPNGGAVAPKGIVAL